MSRHTNKAIARLMRRWLFFSSICLLLLTYLAGPSGRLLATGVIVLLAPGYLVWQWTGRDLHLPRLATPAIWIGASLSLIPIAFLWGSTLGLRLTGTVLQLVAAALVLLVVWLWLRESPTRDIPPWLAISLGTVVALVGLTRWLEISSTPIAPNVSWRSNPRAALATLATLPSQLRSFQSVGLPLWVDSVHHTLLVRVVGETGQIPTNLEPYLPIPELRYHWGYHTVAATWRALAHLPLGTAVLWSGQVLNATMALSMYGLGAYVLRSPLGGLTAALTAGLLSLLPAYYVTWGRYTQLTGLLILAALLVATMALLERPNRSWRQMFLAALLLAGVLLVHYRVTIFYAAFLIPYSVALFLRRGLRWISTIVGRVLLVSLLAALLTAPWFWVLLHRVLAPFARTPALLAGSDGYNALDRELLLAGNATILFALATLGGVIALYQRRWRVLVVVGWIGMLLLLANPSVIGLRSSWLINNHSVAITLFMPVAILVGMSIQSLYGWLVRYTPRVARPALRLLAGAGFVFIALMGAWQLRNVINPATVLALPADVRAITWAAQHTPADARFLVNSTHWLNGAYRGTDAGWWLLPLAGRWVSTPPALYIYGRSDYKEAVERFNQRVASLTATDEAGLETIIQEARITHIYIGAKQSGPLRSDILMSHPDLIPIYNDEGVVIFAVRRSHS